MIFLSSSADMPIEVQLPSAVAEQGVLVVDDSVLQRASAVNCLRALGLEKIFEAGDGQDALTILYSLGKQPAVMLLDLELPGMDGIEVLQHLRNQSERPEIVLVSSSDEVLINAVATMAEAIGVPLLGAFRKPLTPALLAETLERYGSKHSASPSPRQLQPAPELAQLEQALALGEIRAYYQPKINLQQPQLAGWEVLARWTDGQGRNYSPAEFIPLAESQGLIGELTLNLLDQVLADMQRWQHQGVRTAVALNLSAISLNQAEIASEIIQRVSASGLSPRTISFEITESALVMDVPAALASISRLRLKGFGFSIDDYGTGFSSMQQLSRFPFTELKIDRSFVQGASKQAHVRQILQSAVDMGKRMGITSVGEGVETEEELHLLKSLGCRQAQGYLIARPMPANDVIPWIQQQLAAKLQLCQEQ